VGRGSDKAVRALTTLTGRDGADEMLERHRLGGRGVDAVGLCSAV